MARGQDSMVNNKDGGTKVPMQGTDLGTPTCWDLELLSCTSSSHRNTDKKMWISTHRTMISVC